MSTMTFNTEETLGPDAALQGDSVEQPITMTARALAHIRRELEKQNEAIGFRIGVAKSGCSGLQYVVDFVREPKSDDLVFQMDGDLRVYVSPKSLDALKGMRIDFVREGLSQMLKFENPNVTSECGCGESFSVS